MLLQPQLQCACMHTPATAPPRVGYTPLSAAALAPLANAGAPTWADGVYVQQDRATGAVTSKMQVRQGSCNCSRSCNANRMPSVSGLILPCTRGANRRRLCNGLPSMRAQGGAAVQLASTKLLFPGCRQAPSSAWPCTSPAWEWPAGLATKPAGSACPACQVGGAAWLRCI